MDFDGALFALPHHRCVWKLNVVNVNKPLKANYMELYAVYRTDNCSVNTCF